MVADARLKSVWLNMKHRCLNPRDTRFKDYGGRGITICDEWLDYEKFALDMGPHPGSGLSLDRIDTNGNYEPSNCRWATVYEQAANRRNTQYVELDGKRYTTTELAEMTGLSRGVIYSRIARGMPPEKIAFVGRMNSLKTVRAHIARKSAERRAATHCPQGHEFTPETVYIEKSGRRVCKICRRAMDRRRGRHRGQKWRRT